jgi:hypothetical protein
MMWAAEELELFSVQGLFVGVKFLEVEVTSAGSILRTRYVVRCATGLSTSYRVARAQSLIPVRKIFAVVCI